MDNRDPVELLYLACCEDGDVEGQRHYEAILDEPLAAKNALLERPEYLRKCAEWYASKGIPVFPLQPRDKRPMPGFKWQLEMTTDVRRVGEWWGQWPDANVGAATGYVFDVIDVDGPEGHVALSQVEHLPTVVAQSITSRPGGRHMFVRPTGSGNRAGMLPSVDYRGAGGYVVLPPSVGANGRRYHWLYPLELP